MELNEFIVFGARVAVFGCFIISAFRLSTYGQVGWSAGLSLMLMIMKLFSFTCILVVISGSAQGAGRRLGGPRGAS